MKIIKNKEAKYLKIIATVKHWEDSLINGKEDESGETIPFNDGSDWCPVIDIDQGVVLDWPKDKEAEFYFKVSDTGAYYLLDKNKDVIAESVGYVPLGLCHGEDHDSDYIIFNVNKNGVIENYSNKIDLDEWQIT